MDVICTLYWTDNKKYKLVSSWNDTLIESSNINDVCTKLKEEHKKAKEREKEVKNKK